MAPAAAPKPMTKAQLIAHLAEEVELTKKQAAEALEVLAQTAYKEAKNGFTLPGIGKLVLYTSKPRDVKLPGTDIIKHVPSKTQVKFRVAKACKEAVQAKKGRKKK